MIVGYFDDSGSDRQSPVAIMAGYIAPEKEWKSFERKAKKLFDQERIPYLRAKLFDHGEKQFKGWSDARKLRVSVDLFDIAREHIVRGVSAGVDKQDYIAAKKSNPKFSAGSATAYCMQIALRHLLEDDQIASAVKEHELQPVIESGTYVDAGIKQDIDRILNVNEVRGVVRSPLFVPKTAALAVQLADFLAYYSHRFALTARNDSDAGRTEYLAIAQDNVPTIMKFAHKFSINPDFVRAEKDWRRKAS